MSNWRWILTNKFACLFFGVLGVFLLSHLNSAMAAELMSPGPNKAPLIYALKLPQYCQGQYFGRKEPQYQLPRELCGVGTNHFCEGLIRLYKARATTDRAKKAEHYRSAKRPVEYTKRWIADHPRCPLHPTVNQVLNEIDLKLKMYK